ncbi:hypothetical protein NHQ30_008563 [Ciborinia camelliae]|nr:hypothetical protein NHQ30_008563 [Ciborinia camelliae]
MEVIEARHIQMADSSSIMEPHWGYVDRVLPCTNDAGSCEYLDAVYHSHDLSMLYTFILWAVIGSLIVILAAFRLMKPSGKTITKARDSEIQSSAGISPWYYRAWRGTTATFRRYLLPEICVKFFGNVTRLQILILAILLGYLLIFTLVGNVYKVWITPVKKTNLHNTRSWLGGFSDRVGALAYALTPFTVLLSTRESALSLATGIPYQSFNFLHRWLGRIMFIQAALHTFGWTLVEARLYQPQPTLYQNFIKQRYIIWGCIALALLCFLYVFSIKRVIRWTGYEFFRKAHYVVASESTLQYFDDKDGGVIRLEFDHRHAPWTLGQHFFLCFPALSIWQSHPLTVASLPSNHHTYIIRCRSGETGNLKKLALGNQLTTPVILSGPYGESLLNPKEEPTNILAIAGGTGVSLTLPLVLAATASDTSIYKGRAIDFIWIVRRSSCLKWITKELNEIRRRANDRRFNFHVHIYVTQEEAPPTGEGEGEEKHSESDMLMNEEKIMETIDKTLSDSMMSIGSGKMSSPAFRISYLGGCKCCHPDLNELVRAFMHGRAGSRYRTRVVASGPKGIGRDLRSAVAECNDGGAVLRGARIADVELVWDARD